MTKSEPQTYDDGFDDFFAQVKQTGQYDCDRIEHAYQVAKAAHAGQFRRSGEPYIMHPVAVAEILFKLGMDNECIIGALLHDVVEDTSVTLDDIKKDFGDEVALLVDGVTKLGKIPLTTREEVQAENIRKMFMAMNEDIRVIIIKLADRLHNMRTAKYWPDYKQREKSLETLEFYAPIAHRLGIRQFKDELEDIAISYLDPIGYREIEDSLKMKTADGEKFLDEITNSIQERIQNIDGAQITHRVKSVHGIYRKLYMKNKSFDEIYDIYAVRIIVNTVIDCYNVLGIIHDMFTPLPRRFKDYISTPKPNMYQSLHTTVMYKGIPFEVQIRTWEMHRTAEFGIAAHWKYKLSGSGKANTDMGARLAWVRRMLETGEESVDPDDMVRSIKTDLSVEEIYVFTPKGEVKCLPNGSTVIDFAYAIHTEVGNKMAGAKVDGRIVPIDYKLRTGERVEVILSKQPGKGPSRDWLSIVKTGEARNKIRSWFKRERREENIGRGRAQVENEFKRNYIRFENDDYEKFIRRIAEKQHCQSVDDFYAALGYGGLNISKLMPSIKEEYTRNWRHAPAAKSSNYMEISSKPSKSSGGIVVEGIDNCLINMAQCCNPVPGDDIIGFITRGRGLTIHRRNCVNVPKDLENSPEPQRWVAAHWDASVKVEAVSTLNVYAIDRDGVVLDITMALSNMHVKIQSLNARPINDGNCITTIVLCVNGREHLEGIVSRLYKINGVYHIERNGE